MTAILNSFSAVMFLALVSLLALQAYNIVFHKNIPNFRTAPAIRKKIIQLLKDDFEARGGAPYTIVDLGSGNGLFTREIAKALPRAKVKGIELARLNFMWANRQKRRAGLDNLEYLRMNFFDYDLSGADAVVMYLIPYLMKNLGEKLHKETRPGTLIVSNKFLLQDGWKPVETISVKTLYLHQEKVFVYRKA